MEILISGAGIAGPTLAWWLAEHDHRPVIVEQAPEPRTGGYIIDFWGKGYDIAEKMGLMPQLNEAGYRVEEVRLVGDDGRRVGGFPASVFERATHGRFVSLPRGELSAALNRAVAGRAETIFGDGIEAIEDGGVGVGVTFESGGRRRFDLVIGAEGIHSKTRSLVFGPQERFEKYLGYKFAAYTVPGYAGRDELAYVNHADPGRSASRFSLRDGSTLVLLIWIDDLNRDLPDTAEGARELVRSRFSGMEWEAPRMLDALDRAHDLYVDRVSQIRMERWHRRRIGLVGDAAFAPSFLAGQGSALAMIGAYVLAGELQQAADDHEAAFRAYEDRLQPMMTAKQDAASRLGGSFAPRTQMGVTMRNWISKAMRIDWVADRLMGESLTDQAELPDY